MKKERGISPNGAVEGFVFCLDATGEYTEEFLYAIVPLLADCIYRQILQEKPS